MTQGRPLVGVRVLLALLALLGSLVLLSGSPASATTTADEIPPTPTPGEPWFGPGLDWSKDLPASYSRRLGEQPSLYAQRIRYPMTAQDREFLVQFAQQAASQGTVAVVSLELTKPLAALRTSDAERLARTLQTLHRQLDSFFLVRFAPEMNGSWVAWGQQPTAYKKAFRVVADQVHEVTPWAKMVWAPAYGAGYPFGRAYGAVDPSGDRETAELDTDGNGRVNDGDDPYGPYYPGDAYVDWVGLSQYHYGREQDFGTNTAPLPDEFVGRMDEEYGYQVAKRRESFYDRFAKSRDLPLLLETGALYNPADEAGDDELDIKESWWEQVFDADSRYPLIGAISWLELQRKEAEVGDRTVDWAATDDPTMAARLRADLADSSVRMGPVTRELSLEAANEATAQARNPDFIGDELGWIVFCVVTGAVLYVLAGAAGRWIPSWRYPNEDDPRDKRLDLFRGWIIIAVVITHIEVFSPYSVVTLKMIGAITGAELFVLLSGIVLGMIYLPTVKRFGEWPTAVIMWRRARKQYLTALSVVMIVFLLSKVPFINADVVTTFTDRGTGENGEAVQGTVYNLYPNAEQLFAYPPPWYAIKQFLLLEMGPWVFNIMGLFVVLSLLLPILMVLVKRKLWWLLLIVSWAVYVYGTIEQPHWIPSQFDAVFPLLIWQLPFCHGLVLGVYRKQVTKALTSTWGKVAVSTAMLGYAAVLLYLWLGHHYGFVPAPFPATSYGWLYDNFYIRVFLQPGRLIDLAFMVVLAYAVTTMAWKPVNKAIGWFWIPLGQSSLYVFIVHVFFVLAVGNIPGLDRNSLWQGTIIHTVVLLVIWVMVKKEFLFKVIPR